MEERAIVTISPTSQVTNQTTATTHTCIITIDIVIKQGDRCLQALLPVVTGTKTSSHWKQGEGGEEGEGEGEEEDEEEQPTEERTKHCRLITSLSTEAKHRG